MKESKESIFKMMALLEKGRAKTGFCWKCKTSFWYVVNFKNTHSCPECGNGEKMLLSMN